MACHVPGICLLGNQPRPFVDGLREFAAEGECVISKAHGVPALESPKAIAPLVGCISRHPKVQLCIDHLFDMWDHHLIRRPYERRKIRRLAAGPLIDILRKLFQMAVVRPALVIIPLRLTGISQSAAPLRALRAIHCPLLHHDGRDELHEIRMSRRRPGGRHHFVQLTGGIRHAHGGLLMEIIHIHPQLILIGILEIINPIDAKILLISISRRVVAVVLHAAVIGNRVHISKRDGPHLREASVHRHAPAPQLPRVIAEVGLVLPTSHLETIGRRRLTGLLRDDLDHTAHGVRSIHRRRRTPEHLDALHFGEIHPREKIHILRLARVLIRQPPTVHQDQSLIRIHPAHHHLVAAHGRRAVLTSPRQVQAQDGGQRLGHIRRPQPPEIFLLHHRHRLRLVLQIHAHALRRHRHRRQSKYLRPARHIPRRQSQDRRQDFSLHSKYPRFPFLGKPII